MTLSTKRLGAAALAAMAIAVAAPVLAHAGTDDRTEAKAFLASGMSIADAVSAAEAKGGGSAMSASWEPQEGRAMAFEVELAKADGTVTTMVVDPGTGRVTAAADRDDDGIGSDERGREDEADDD